ncbi:unnamed protein product [Closterium sp. Naga37s-1]|nr:unnamed protein product [Closterium sp. Naga37s-1]
MQLPEFIKNHQSLEKREMKAEGVGADGTPVSFVYIMHERPLPDHETDGDVTVDPAGHFGAGEKMQLPEFIKNHQSLEKREMKAEGVGADGTPVSFVYIMHERPLPDHETDGDVTVCVELSLEFVKAVDAELEWRMCDLHLLEGSKLFRTASYLPDDAKRVEALKKWLGQLHKLYSNKLPGEFVC